MTGFPPKVRQLVLDRASGHCERCGAAETSFELHHRRPRGMGGSKRDDTNTAPNALALCQWCHKWVEVNRNNAFKGGWLLLQTQNPAEIPVLRRGHWVRLDVNGTVKQEGGHAEWAG